MVKEARFNLTEVLRDDEHEDVINDWFVHYVGIGVQSFGEPSDMVPGRGKRAWWVRANGAVIMLSGGSPAISLRVISPQGVEYM